MTATTKRNARRTPGGFDQATPDLSTPTGGRRVAQGMALDRNVCQPAAGFIGHERVHRAHPAGTGRGGGAANLAYARCVKALQFADSFSRMSALLALRRYPDFWSHVGHEWAGCDNVGMHQDEINRLIGDHQRARGLPIWDAMDREARVVYDALPELVTVWRGCYSHNVYGLSWTLNAAVAARFPFLNRYRQDNAIDRALLIEARVKKSDIAFLVTERDEEEVVASPVVVEIVGQSLAFDALDDDVRSRKFPLGRATA